MLNFCFNLLSFRFMCCHLFPKLKFTVKKIAIYYFKKLATRYLKIFAIYYKLKFIIKKNLLFFSNINMTITESVLVLLENMPKLEEFTQKKTIFLQCIDISTQNPRWLLRVCFPSNCSLSAVFRTI